MATKPIIDVDDHNILRGDKRFFIVGLSNKMKALDISKKDLVTKARATFKDGDKVSGSTIDDAIRKFPIFENDARKIIRCYSEIVAEKTAAAKGAEEEALLRDNSITDDDIIGAFFLVMDLRDLMKQFDVSERDLGEIDSRLNDDVIEGMRDRKRTTLPTALALCRALNAVLRSKGKEPLDPRKFIKTDSKKKKKVAADYVIVDHSTYEEWPPTGGALRPDDEPS